MSFWDVNVTLMKGLVVSVELFFLTLLFAIPLGLVICLGSMNGWRPLRFLAGRGRSGGARAVCGALGSFMPVRAVCRLVVWIIRGTPLMLQILVVYFGPGLMFHWPLLPRFTAALLTFVINYACYFSEIYRGGIQAIPRGQYEAGQVLGMTRAQTFFHVILLQLIKNVVPPMGNELITLVKDTALVRVISVYELIWMGESFIRKGFIWPLFYTGVFYLAFSGLLTLLLGWFEKKLSYFRA